MEAEPPPVRPLVEPENDDFLVIFLVFLVARFYLATPWGRLRLLLNRGRASSIIFPSRTREQELKL